MRRALCAFSLLLAFSAAAAGQESRPHARTKEGQDGGQQKSVPPRRRLVEEVAVEGNRLLSDTEILAHVRTRPGATYNESQVRRDLHALLDTGAFDPAQTRVQTTAGLRGGVVVIFLVMELPVIAELRFEGLPKGLTEADVLKALRAEGIKLSKGDVYDPAGLRRAVAVIKRLLAARGFRSMSVESFIEEVSQTHVRLRIGVTEGRYF